MHNDQKLVGTVKSWRARAEDMMRLPPRSAGSREMRVNADQLLALIAEFEKLSDKTLSHRNIPAGVIAPDQSSL